MDNKIKLHLGCGEKIIPNYVNIDIRGNLKCDLIDDISKLENFKKNSVDEIYCCHVLEHFGRHQYLNVLKRWYDVLKIDGILKLSVPDFKSVFEMYKEGYPLKKLYGFIYGGQTYPENFHHVGFDFESLKEDLESVGFEKIELWDWKKTEHNYIDDYSQSYLPHLDKENGKLMSLNIRCTKNGNL